MKHRIFTAIVVIATVLVIYGCSGNDSPVLPSDSASTLLPEEFNRQTHESTTHNLWSISTIYIDPASGKWSVLPVRDASIHWNVLSWLENGPCTNCIQLTGIQPSGTGTLEVDVRITSPFDNPKLTGFDVRGIAMFDGSAEFPISGLTYSDRALGNGELVNADGYTALYNSSTIGSGPGGLQGYQQGKFATVQVPDALLSGYMRYISSDAANTRNAFYAGDEITLTYEIDMPDGPFVLGYAVDANWAPPLVDPVTDPITDFPPEANCPEPWKIEVTEESDGPGLYESGGQTKLQVDVYDWQGSTSHFEPVVECPDIFSGTIEADFSENGDGYARYEIIIVNELLPGIGEYRCLVSVEDTQNESAPDWLDLTLYGIVSLNVSETPNLPPVAAAHADVYEIQPGEYVQFTDDSTDPDGVEDIVKWEWDFDYSDYPGFIAESEEQNPLHQFLEPYYQQVQLRVTDTEGHIDLLEEPLEIHTTPCNPFNITNVTPPGYSYQAGTAATDSNYLYVPTYFDELLIFDLTDPVKPDFVKSVGPYSGIGAYSGIEIAADGGYVYILVKDDGLDDGLLHIIDVDPPEDAEIINSIDAISGRCLLVNNGYAYIGGSHELNIYDIDPPMNAQLVNSIPIVDGASDIAFNGDLAYIVTTGIKVIDISVPDEAEIIFEFAIDGFISLADYHDGYLFVSQNLLEFVVIDVEPVEDMEIVAELLFTGVPQTFDFVDDHVIIGSSNLEIFSVAQPELPEKIKSLELSQGAGCYYNSGYGYLVSGIYPIEIVEMDPFADAHIVDYYGIKPLDITFQDDLAFVNSIPHGIQVLDISDPSQAHPVKKIDLQSNSACGLDVLPGYLLVADLELGVHIVDIDPLQDAAIVNTVSIPDELQSVVIAANYAYLPGNSGLHILDITDPVTAGEICLVPTPLHCNAITVLGNYAYAAGGTDGLYIFNIENPAEAELVSIADVGMSNILHLESLEHYIYAGQCDVGVAILDVSIPESPNIIKVLPPVSLAMALYDGYLFSSGLHFMKIYDVQPPEAAHEICSEGNYYYGFYGIEVWNDHVYVMDYTRNALVIYSLY